MTPPAISRPIKAGLLLMLAVALLAFLARAASAQQAGDSTVRLTLGEAVRMAARQSASVESARYRVEAAQARVTQRRADLLPNVSAAVSERSGTLNSAAAFPIDFPTAPGAAPLFDRNGSILGPLNVFDARVRVTQSLFDPAARTRVQVARTGVSAASAEAAASADLAAAGAANAYRRRLSRTHAGFHARRRVAADRARPALRRHRHRARCHPRAVPAHRLARAADRGPQRT